MQRKIDDDIHLAKTVIPVESLGKSKAIDRTASAFDTANKKVQKTKRLIKTGEYYVGASRYIPGVMNLMFQGKLENVTMREQISNVHYKDMQNLEFQQP